MEITQNTILKLVVRQGTDDERKQVILTSGEPGYVTDTGRLFMGDGFTEGGTLVGNLFKGFTSDLTLLRGEIGDYAFETDQNQFFVLESNDGATLTDWRQVGGIYTGSTYIFVDPSSNQISLLPLSAGFFDNDAVEAPIIISSGRIGLSSNIPFERVSTHTITVSSGLKAFNEFGSEITNQATNPLSSDIFITVGLLSAGMFDKDSVSYALSVDSNGRLEVDPYRFMTFSNGLTASLNGMSNVTDVPVNPLSGSITVGIGPSTVLAILAQSIDPPIFFTGTKFGVTLSSIPISSLANSFTKTITVSSGLAAYIDGIDSTNTGFNPLTSNLIIKIGQLSAGMISSDAVSQGITLQNGKLALSSTINFQRVSNTTITISSGLASVINGTLNTSPVTVNSLSSNIVLMSNEILARYDGLSGQVLRYSRNLLSVIRLSAGDYIFRYNVPTSDVYPMVIIYSAAQFELIARPIFFDLSACRVLILSANNFALRDANIIFKMSY